MTIRTLEELNAVVDEILSTKQTPKTLQALTSTSSFANTDFLVTSSATTGNTTKIAKQDFVEAIGNPAIDGYNCVTNTQDQYTLMPVSGNTGNQYYPDMTVSFIADTNSIGNAQLRISNLPLKNFYKYNTSITVDVVEGEYYEAVYMNGDFHQTNAKDVGQPTLMGYNSAADQANQIRLTSINGINIGTYRDNQLFGFISPINSTGNVTMQVDGLGLRNFYQYDTTNAVDLEIGKYYEAIYVGNATVGVFYLTNARTATLFSNEYTAVGTVALDELSTTYQLTSAIGAPTTSYYPAMSLVFTVDITSKGVVFVNVDGLGDKVLGEGANDPIANNLYAGQPLLATYDAVTGEFNKHRFAVTNPPAPPIDPDEPIPDENLVDINVGPNSPIKTITNAIKALVEEFGNDGGNRLATIHLDNDFVWNEQIVVPAERDYSWITITNNISIFMTNNSETSMTIMSEAESPIITGTYHYTGGHLNIFNSNVGSTYNILNAYFTTSNTSARLFSQYNFKATNLNTTGFSEIFRYRTTQLPKAGIVELENCTFLDFTYSFYGNKGGTIKAKDCSIDSSINTATRAAIFLSTESNIEFTNCTIGSSPGKTQLTLTNMATGSLTDCRSISRSNSQTGVEVSVSSRLLIDGGDYRTFDDSVVATNIVAASSSIITLVNNPLGGTSAITDGEIVII